MISEAPPEVAAAMESPINLLELPFPEFYNPLLTLLRKPRPSALQNTDSNGKAKASRLDGKTAEDSEDWVEVDTTGLDEEESPPSLSGLRKKSEAAGNPLLHSKGKPSNAAAPSLAGLVAPKPSHDHHAAKLLILGNRSRPQGSIKPPENPQLQSMETAASGEEPRQFKRKLPPNFLMKKKSRAAGISTRKKAPTTATSSPGISDNDAPKPEPQPPKRKQTGKRSAVKRRKVEIGRLTVDLSSGHDESKKLEPVASTSSKAPGVEAQASAEVIDLLDSDSSPSPLPSPQLAHGTGKEEALLPSSPSLSHSPPASPTNERSYQGSLGETLKALPMMERLKALREAAQQV